MSQEAKGSAKKAKSNKNIINSKGYQVVLLFNQIKLRKLPLKQKEL